MASSIPTAAVTVALAAGFGVALDLGLWLAVVAMVATAITLVACQRLGALVVARRAATWALYAPQGTTPASHLERTVAADLATVAVGDASVLDHTITRAHDTIADPWVRGLAVERLQLAKELLADGALPTTPSCTRGTCRAGHPVDGRHRDGRVNPRRRRDAPAPAPRAPDPQHDRGRHGLGRGETAGSAAQPAVQRGVGPTAERGDLDA